MESSLKLIATLLNDLRDAGILEFEFVSPHLASQVRSKEVEKAIQSFASNLRSTLEEKPLDRDNVQIKAPTREILYKRISAFLQRKNDERQKLIHFVQGGECSRTLPYRYRRISRELTCNRVGPSAEALKSTACSEDRSLESRILTMETQLSVKSASTADLLQRIKILEDRLLYLESVTPEYQNLKYEFKDTDSIRIETTPNMGDNEGSITRMQL